jgi:hypothetical protein
MDTEKSTKAGWVTDEWCNDAGVGRSTSYVLESTGKIKVVRVGTRRIIITSPAQFLASLAEQQAAAE